MNRSDFLKRLWNQFLRLGIILVVIHFSVQFLISVLTKNGPERLFTIAIVTLFTVFALAYLAGSIFNKAGNRLYTKLSKDTKRMWHLTLQVVEYVAVMVLGVILYKFWLTDAMTASILIVILISDRIYHIVTEQKLKATK